MSSFSPSDVAAIQSRFRNFNSSGASTDFTPPQNTPPTFPAEKSVVPKPLKPVKTTLNAAAPPKPVPVVSKTTASKPVPAVSKITASKPVPVVSKTTASKPVPAVTKPIPQVELPKPVPKQVEPPLPAASTSAKPRQQTTAEILAEIKAVPITVEIVNKLRSFQIEHVQNLQWAIEHNTIAFDGSDTGTGKTYTAAALAKNRGLSIIVICPKSVIPTWYKVLGELDVEILMIVNYETLKNGKYYTSLSNYHEDEREECPYITITREVVYDSMTQEPIRTKNGSTKMQVTDIQWNFPNDTLVVFDEAHKGKNGLNAVMPTINSRLMVSTKQYFSKERNVFGVFLSATITDKMANFDVISFLLGMYKPYIKKSYKMFLRDMTSDPTRLLEAVHTKIFPRLGSRMNIKRIKESGNLSFKENIIRARAYAMDQDTYDQIENAHIKIKNALTQLRTRMLTDGPHPLVVILRERQRIELLKVPIFVSLIKYYLGLDELPEDYRSSEDPIVDDKCMIDTPKNVAVFCSFNETIGLLASKLTDGGVPLSKLDFIQGGQTGEERSDIINKFQNNELNVLICNSEAGGVGISLQDLLGKQRVAFHNPTWSAVTLKQGLGRIYRADALSDAIQFIVYAKTPAAFDDVSEPGIEEMMCANVNEKMRNVALLNDGDLQNYIDITSKEISMC